ncbi:MAG: hypothetical protein QG603_538 [Patescibacteria group bacterium]|jgi:hypothetical protein|nr:hypothetical protein [Patescibacteria group bacterium]MDQ5970761.1 hypothetical protein [Patescibacteria group bacterium]
MNAKNYSLIMGAATIIAWVGFFTIIFNFDPQEANWIIFILFYLSLFLAVSGTLSIIGFFARILLLRKRSILRYLVAESFRQATIVAAALVVTMILQSVRILTWWNMALLILAAAALEFLILLFKKNQPDNFQS